MISNNCVTFIQTQRVTILYINSSNQHCTVLEGKNLYFLDFFSCRQLSVNALIQLIYSHLAGKDYQQSTEYSNEINEQLHRVPEIVQHYHWF